jgi:hypothetical protein
MRARARENAIWIVLGAAATAAMAWVGLVDFTWTDYETEALPAVQALVHGHLHSFFTSAPVYGSSLLERAPFAFVPGLWGGGDLAVYRMLALPCLLGGLLLGLWLLARIRAQGASRFTQAVTLGLCVANPLTLAGLELGHPEELLGGALCVAAVLLAARERPLWAGLALGAAIADKQWALLALGPVLLALPTRRMLCTSLAGAVSVALLAPFLLVAPETFKTATHLAATPDSTIFQPWQLWWFLGHHGHVVHGLFGAIKPGYRTAPSWAGPISHPLIMALGLPLTLGAWAKLRRDPAFPNAIATAAFAADAPLAGTSPEERLSASLRLRESHALLLLALLLLLRCMLDTWDIVYYPLPFVLALGAWEALGLGRVPVLALASSVAVWGEWRWLPSYISADGQAAFFAAWAIPLAVGLGLALYRRPARAPADARVELGIAPQPRTPELSAASSA